MLASACGCRAGWPVQSARPAACLWHRPQCDACCRVCCDPWSWVRSRHPFLPRQTYCPGRHGASRGVLPHAGLPAAPDARPPKLLSRASRTRRRQQLVPEPQPISAGSTSHGRPDFSTNRMLVSAARSDRRGRPPFGFGRSGGRSRDHRL